MSTMQDNDKYQKFDISNFSKEDFVVEKPQNTDEQSSYTIKDSSTLEYRPTEHKSLGEYVTDFITKHPFITGGIILCGSMFITCDLISRSISRGIYKGYMKSIRDIYKVIR